MKTLAICAAVALLAAPAAGFAATANDSAATAAKVTYGDLNLSQSHDATVMMGRLDRASMSACGASKFSLREYRDAVRGSACYRDSLSKAVADLNAPSVTAIYNQRVEYKLASN